MLLQQYITNYDAQVNDKPTDSTLDDQVAKVEGDGTVVVQFRSRDVAKVEALRDYLNELLGEP